MNIDVHAHAFGPKFREAAEALRAGAASGVRPGIREEGRPLEWFEPDHALRDMDAKKFDMRIVSHGPDIAGFTPAEQVDLARRANDEMIALARTHPDRLRVLATLPFGDIDACVVELDRIRSAPEMVGVFMRSNFAGERPSEPRYEPVWAKIDELRMPVVEHPAFPVFSQDLRKNNHAIVLGFMFETQIMVVELIQAGVFERYPDFPFVVAHTGGGLLDITNRVERSSARHPDVKDKIKKPVSEYVKRFYFDTCSFYEPPLMMAHNYFGRDRLMFGTDYPYVDANAGYIEALPLEAADKAAIMGGNAARVFGLG